MDKGRYKGLPQDENGKPVNSSTSRKLLTLAGDNTWKNVTVPEGAECKACLVVVHTMDATNFSNFLPPGEYHYYPDASVSNPTEWIPMQSGPQPWAGKEGTVLGKVRAVSGKITIMMMS